MRTIYYTLLLAALTLSSPMVVAQQAEKADPYAALGHTPYVAGAEKEQAKVFTIENFAEGSLVGKIEHNPQTGEVKLFAKNGSLLGETQLSSGERAWTTIDPLAEKHYNTSPYAYVLNNPLLYADPTGMDTVYVNSQGYIQRVQQSDGALVIYNPTASTSYNFNDADVDMDQFTYLLPEDRYGYDYVGDPIQLFVSISEGKMTNLMKEAGVGEIGLINAVLSVAGIDGPKYIIGGIKGLGDFDFAGTLYNDYGKAKGARDVGTIRSTYDDATGGFYRMGSSTTLYNMHDAGNFLTGMAFKFGGYSQNDITTGAHINEVRQLRLGDSKADQRAIKAGYSYKFRQR